MVFDELMVGELNCWIEIWYWQDLLLVDVEFLYEFGGQCCCWVKIELVGVVIYVGSVQIEEKVIYCIFFCWILGIIMDYEIVYGDQVYWVCWFMVMNGVLCFIMVEVEEF